MRAYYLERHLRRKLAPLLSEDSERAVAEAQPDSPVEPAQVSPAAQSIAASKRTLLEHLGALALNYVTVAQHDQLEFPLVAQPTALQTKAFALLDVDPAKIVSSEMAS